MLSAYKARGFSAGELLKALRFLKEGRPIALAAEGEITWDGRLQHPLAPGAAWMALRAHVPVVPVISVGGYDIMPRWARFPKLTGRVIVRAGMPFYVGDEPPDRVTPEMVSAASETIYHEMAALLD
jgi:1-acyl-sn-glycerol-3-phosphate acyltransferase